MKFKILIFLTIIMSLHSCFDVVEDITIREDKSGTLKLTANFSQSSSTLNTIMALDSAFGFSIPKQSAIEESFIKATNKLKLTPGVTNVSYHTDFTNYLFDISYDFKDQKTLNVSFLEVAKLFDKKATLPYLPFELSKTSLKRNHEITLTDYQKERITKKFATGLESANYITVYRLPKPVNSSTNKKAKIAKNNKIVINKVKLGELLFQPEKLTNTITYK